MTPDQLSENDKRLLRALETTDSAGWRRGNIAAVHFDGPDLELMISVHRELERIASDQRRT